MEITKGTLILKLDKSIEEIMASFDKDTRYCIRKSEKEHIQPTIYENVFVVHLQDKQFKPSSMLVFKIENNKATLLATNTDSALKQLQGNSGTYWEMIKLAKSKGATEIDFGGIETENPTESQERINKFKQGFNGELITWKTNVTLIEWLKSKLKKYFKK